MVQLLTSPPGKGEFQKWFPFSTVRLAEKPPTDDKIIKNVIENYFEEHSKMIDKIISKEERAKVLDDLNNLLRGVKFGVIG